MTGAESCNTFFDPFFMNNEYFGIGRHGHGRVGNYAYPAHEKTVSID
ncbi:hypothetical protein [uncultured Acinetobacter sp.]|nr:hypothetical protein [uncultured Acinetobacter sp.]